MSCPLCKGEHLTSWYYEDDVCWVDSVRRKLWRLGYKPTKRLGLAKNFKVF